MCQSKPTKSRSQRGVIELWLAVLLLVVLVGAFSLLTTQKKATTNEFAKTVAFYALSKAAIVTIIGGDTQWVPEDLARNVLGSVTTSFTAQAGFASQVSSFIVTPGNQALGLRDIEPFVSITSNGAPPTGTACLDKMVTLVEDPNYQQSLASGAMIRQIVCIECLGGECEPTIMSAQIAQGAPAGAVVPPTPTVTPTSTPGLPPTPDPCEVCWAEPDPCDACLCRAANSCGSSGNCSHFCNPY